jgi:hypothetical protein
MACWATVYTMMLSWRRQQSFDIPSALEAVGKPYVSVFQTNTGLPPSEFGPFLRAAGMACQPMMNLAIAEWERLLRIHGLLWVGALSSTRPGAGLHSRIVEGVSGNGTPDGTSLMIIDPAGGRQYLEGFRSFVAKYEGAVHRTTGEYYQIRHFS